MANWGRECRVRFEAPRYAAENDPATNEPILEGWDLVGEVWGFIREVNEREKVEAAQQNLVLDVRFTVRFRPALAAMTNRHQAVCEGVTYALAGVRELTQVDGKPSRREWLTVAAKAKAEPGA